MLREYGIDAFVAHDDIAPTRVWENEIIAALRSCNALVALLADDARASAWVDQECGWAMARGVPIISVDIGMVPYGFFGRYQALPGRGRGAAEIAYEVFRILLANGSAYWTLVEGLVANLERSESFKEANLRFRLLERLAPQGLAEDHLDRIEAAFRESSQVAGAFDVQRGVQQLLASHRQAWAEFWDEEKRAKYELDR